MLYNNGCTPVSIFLGQCRGFLVVILVGKRLVPSGVAEGLEVFVANVRCHDHLAR